jgi:TPR repeat protein
MDHRPRIHTQRIAVVLTVVLAAGLCFVPLGKIPLVWTVHGIVTARKLVLGLCGVAILVALLGRRREAMVWPVRIASYGLAGIAVAFCLFRIVVLGHRAMPTFDDDDPQAAAYYTRACDADVMEACSMLGTCYWTGSCGVNKDGERGLALFQKACDGGDMGACGQLGTCYEVGGCGLMKSGERAVAFYQKACAGGEMSMCNNLGVCYFKGECGLGKDDKRAAALYNKACRGGDSSACHNLAVMKE